MNLNHKSVRLHAELEKVRGGNPNGNLVPDEAIEYARDHPDSELHSRLTWDDTEAAANWRRTQMTHIIRAVYIQVNSDPTPVHAYWSPPSHRNGEDGYVHISKVRTDAEIAAEIARDMLVRMQAAHEDLLVAVDALPKLRPAARAVSRAVTTLEKVIDEQIGPAPERRAKRTQQGRSGRVSREPMQAQA